MMRFREDPKKNSPEKAPRKNMSFVTTQTPDTTSKGILSRVSLESTNVQPNLMRHYPASVGLNLFFLGPRLSR